MLKRADADFSAKQAKTVFMVFLAIVIAGALLFLNMYGRYNDRVLYEERLSQMGEVTTELFDGLDDIIDSKWHAVDTQVNYLRDESPQDVKALVSFMERQHRLANLGDEGTDIIMVDDKGRYYTQAGPKGSMQEMDHLLGNPERINYVTTTMTTNKTLMVFLERLEQPVRLSLGDGQDTKIVYAGLLCNMEELEPYFSCEAYDGANNVIVVDNDGSKLFSSNNSPIRGHNAFSVLKQMRYLHGSSFDKAAAELEANGVAYSNAVLDDEEYYYALSRMDSADWTLVFLVPARYVATNTVGLVNTTVKLVMGFAFALVTACAVAIYIVLRAKQRQVLEIEHKNAEGLKRVNAELDTKNEELEFAVRDAQVARSQAEASNHAKSDFLANMSHDIRTPMNAIVGITNLIEHGTTSPEQLADYIQKIKLSSNHMLSLINDILDMSKIESDKVELQLVPVSLAEQINQVDNIIRAQALGRHHEFHIFVNDLRHEYLVADGVRLRQTILNLLSNAVKYTPDGGQVELSITELNSGDADYARLLFEVTDTGIGMDEEFLKYIFDPFSRAESSGTNKVQGTGLGMAIAKNIVELMGGSIEVESTPGKGSKFTVVLDLAIDKDASYDIGVERMLLVCGEQRLERNVSMRCEEAGIVLDVAKSVEDACAGAAAHIADVILLAGCVDDPALEASIAALREAAGEDGPLVFCIDYALRGQVTQRVVAAGADGFVSRPFFLAELEGVVRRVYGSTATPTSDTSVLNGMRFLCAEDNQLNAEILSALLEMSGASCEVCPDGAAIVERFASVKPGEFDAILMDIQMPRMNGLEATRAIRMGANPLGAVIPIIAMTANAFSEDVRSSLEAGMTAHTSKPIDISLLEKTMEKLVAPPPLDPAAIADE